MFLRSIRVLIIIFFSCLHFFFFWSLRCPAYLLHLDPEDCSACLSHAFPSRFVCSAFNLTSPPPTRTSFPCLKPVPDPSWYLTITLSLHNRALMSLLEASVSPRPDKRKVREAFLYILTAWSRVITCSLCYTFSPWGLGQVVASR